MLLTTFEPENRLVARTLERQWEEALEAEVQLKADHRRFVAEQPATLSRQEREAIRRLATDLPRLWHAETTTAADRQAIIRQLVERIVVTVQGESEKVDVEIHWIGGHRTQTQRIRPVARLDQLSYYPELLARVANLHQQGLGRAQVAQQLNAEGWRPAKRRETFTAAMVGSLLARQGLRASPLRPRSVVRKSDEWTRAELAYRLEMPEPTLYSWLRKGHLKARRDKGSGQWLIWADANELKRLRSLRQAPRIWKRPSARASSE
jgi:hypothetical protein